MTKNEMTVMRVIMGDSHFEVTGEGYEPSGEIRHVPRSPHQSSLPTSLHQLLTSAVLCNGATLQQENGTWRILGDPTEGALLVAAAKAGLMKAELESRAPLDREVPFDTERR